MSVQRSTVVLVHGGWHGSWCWAEVVPLLEQRGVLVRTIDLPSIDADPNDRSALSGDAAAVAALLDDLHEPALLCGHSYGGMVVTQAAAGRTDVARLVYLCAFMPDAGESLLSIIGARAPWIVAHEDGRWLPDLEQAAATFYGDCDADTQRASTARLRARCRPRRPRNGCLRQRGATFRARTSSARRTWPFRSNGNANSSHLVRTRSSSWRRVTRRSSPSDRRSRLAGRTSGR
jgi:pimeloyl-ACP methyl ester carboxylesterase